MALLHYLPSEGIIHSCYCLLYVLWSLHHLFGLHLYPYFIAHFWGRYSPVFLPLKGIITHQLLTSCVSVLFITYTRITSLSLYALLGPLVYFHCFLSITYKLATNLNPWSAALHCSFNRSSFSFILQGWMHSWWGSSMVRGFGFALICLASVVRAALYCKVVVATVCIVCAMYAPSVLMSSLHLTVEALSDVLAASSYWAVASSIESSSPVDVHIIGAAYTLLALASYCLQRWGHHQGPLLHQHIGCD